MDRRDIIVISVFLYCISGWYTSIGDCPCIPVIGIGIILGLFVTYAKIVKGFVYFFLIQILLLFLNTVVKLFQARSMINVPH